MGVEELEFPDTPENEDEEKARPPKPVDDPHLPSDGDLEDYRPQWVQADLRRSRESGEVKDEPNDLSGIEQEFDDT
jgi:hypothetical protein